MKIFVQILLSATLVAAVGSVQGAVRSDFWQEADSTEREQYLPEPMPPGIQVVQTELDGPVFADARGRTLYTWPLKEIRNGGTGDRRGSQSVCNDKVYTETSGLMSPYPAGLQMPELNTRPSCAKMWPGLIAGDDAKPVGKWTIVSREKDLQQWAYDGLPLYTSILDRQAGDVFGGTQIKESSDSPVVRVPVGPAPRKPPEFLVIPSINGRLLVTHKNYSVYMWDGDDPGKSNCVGNCLDEWSPVLAPETAVAQGEWSVVVRSPGVLQWAFRKSPLYTYNKDPRTQSLVGSDVPGWHNVYTQRVLPPPTEFTVQDSRIGQVLADANGKTIYFYNCGDDALDQLACDHPDTTQVFRLAICGNGDPKLCRETFPYVVAAPGAISQSRLWSVVTIDPESGHRSVPGQADALRVWAYRDRPVYTYGLDIQPGDADGDAWGEFYGHRNGFKAFWLRDDFLSNTFRR